jgi:hypothetical protein
MCEKCAELDVKIERYRRLASQVTDPMTTERAATLIAEIKAQKAALHSEQEQ